MSLLINSYKYTRRSTLAYGFFAIILSIFIMSLLGYTPKSFAAPVSGFNAGRIIDDAIFTNSNSMDPNQIQAFFNSKVSACDTNGTSVATEYGSSLTRAQYAASRGWSAPPYTCLKDYSENNTPAAQIIYNIAKQYQINPQVLIVLLQKEQGLVTDSWPLSSQFKKATGYGCPDTAACNSTYYGFTNQVDWAAKMYHSIVINSPTWYTPYVLGNNYIRWSPTTSCGGSTVNIQNRATQALYNYTPYQPNQSALNAGYGTGDGCSAYGNRNFYLYFTDWFGSTTLPTVFKTPTSDTVYLQSGLYKFAVPSVALLRDYGISPESITTLSQAISDSIPLASTSAGLTTNLSYVVKSPSSGTVFLVSLGKKYAFTSMDQLTQYGFTAEDIGYVTDSISASLPTGPNLNGFISSVSSSNVFKLDNGQKQIIFDYSKFISLNPSGVATQVSDNLATGFTSSNPLSDRDVLLSNTNGSIRLFTNNAYYTIPSMDIYHCWGFGLTQDTPLYRIASDDYLPQATSTDTLSCSPQTINGSSYILNGTNRIRLSGTFSNVVPAPSQNLSTIISRLPIRASDLSTVVKDSSSQTVWYIENGTKRPIPTMTDFRLLGFSTSQIDQLQYESLTGLTSGNTKLGVGQVVKTSDEGTVYVITTSNSRLSFASANDFTGHGYGWGSILTVDNTALNASYPIAEQRSVSSYVYRQSDSSVYVISNNQCYKLSNPLLVNYGVSKGVLASTEGADSRIYPNVNFANCSMASEYIKSSISGTVWALEDGKKRAVSSWQALLQYSTRSNPQVITFDESLVQGFNTGTTISL